MLAFDHVHRVRYFATSCASSYTLNESTSWLIPWMRSSFDIQLVCPQKPLASHRVQAVVFECVVIRNNEYHQAYMIFLAQRKLGSCSCIIHIPVICQMHILMKLCALVRQFRQRSRGRAYGVWRLCKNPTAQVLKYVVQSD